MKVFLNLSELKTIRDDLYKVQSNLKNQMQSQKLEPELLEVCEERYAEREKLIDYFIRLIRDSEGA